jgi:hypothetical protein
MESTGALREQGRTTQLSAARALRWGVAILAVGSALIHLSVVREHLQEYWLFGWFFAAVALLQVGWAVAVLRPARWVLWAGTLGNLALVALWTLSRTRGVPIGPEPWQPEGVGVWDSLSTAMEVLTAVGAAFVLWIGGVARGSSAHRAPGPRATRQRPFTRP